VADTAPDQLQIELEGFPSEVRPMQAASVEAPFSSADYVFEVKWDGLRCLMFRDPQGHVHLHDRGLNDLTSVVPEVTAAASRVPRGSVIDGEIVATDRDGRPDYHRLRQRLAVCPEPGSGRSSSPASSQRFTSGSLMPARLWRRRAMSAGARRSRPVRGRATWCSSRPERHAVSTTFAKLRRC